MRIVIQCNGECRMNDKIEIKIDYDEKGKTLTEVVCLLFDNFLTNYHGKYGNNEENIV